MNSIKRVSYWPIQELCQHQPAAQSLLISITNPGSNTHEFTADRWPHVLHLQFSAADARERFKDEQSFTKAQGEQIAEFLMSHPDALNVYVHCGAGEIRSKAVAAAIAENFDLSEGIFEKERLMNTDDDNELGYVNSLIYHFTARAIYKSQLKAKA